MNFGGRQWTHSVLLLLALLCSSGGVSAAATDSRTLVVAVDRDSYHTLEMLQLQELVTEASQSRQGMIDIRQVNDGLTVTFHDLVHDRQVADIVEKRFVAKPKFSLQKSAAVGFAITYSSVVPRAHDAEKVARDFQALGNLVYELRSPLPGVAIEPQDDGAIVRGNDPTALDILSAKAGRGVFIVTPITKTSWHVALNTSLMQDWGPAKKLVAVKSTAVVLRHYLGDPVDLDVLPNGSGVEFVVSNPEAHSTFVEAVRTTFARDPEFVVNETPALVLHFKLFGKATEEEATKSEALPWLHQGPAWDAMERLIALTDPPVDVAIVGDAISLRAKDPSRNADRAAIVREALSSRTDLVVATQADQSLRISLAAGAHLVSAAEPTSQEQLLNAVKARVSALKLSPLSVAAADSEHIRVRFANDTDVAAFRQAVSKDFGLTIRLVDDGNPEDGVGKPPFPGDERLPKAEGGFLWARPAVIVSGGMIADASVGTDPLYNETIVNFHLTNEGRLHFTAATRANVGRRFAIVVDGIVLTAPTIQTPITGNEGQISGRLTPDSASAVVQSILSHRDSVPLKIIGEDAAR